MTSFWALFKRLIAAFLLFSFFAFSVFCQEESLEEASLEEVEEIPLEEAAGESEAINLEEIEEAVEKVREEYLSKDYTGKSSLLAFSEFENEIIQPDSLDGNRVMIYSIGNKTRRRFFDQQYRLERSEFWEINGARDSRIVRQEYFKYFGNEKKVNVKIVENEKDGESIFYRRDGLVEKIEAFKKVEEKPYITQIRRWKYDKDNRISELSVRTFSYNSEEDTKRRGVSAKAFRYKYNPKNEAGEEIPADVSFYENDILKSVEKYSPVLGSYTQQYFFDHGISVKTWFVKYNRVREVIYQNERVLRIHKFDEEE
ncbi:hypothetical protein MSI_11280 [Treponema sp. JC4]|uniref:hypothetical protein n=1 Tax=Treponema sp. JC4 TaxID=1124982 RepID=UPI00025AFBCA|nr:hypothetical protein [Treponema sp. JC4]EID85410.1 hypothetical protein MSI_11280 [Treponema sp. JC4]